MVGFYKKESSWCCGVAAFDSTNVSGCCQLVIGSEHARGGTLGLLITDVPDLVRVAVVAPIGNLDHSSLAAFISIAQDPPNLCVSIIQFFCNTKLIGIQFVVQYRICPGVTFGVMTFLLRFRTSICWLIVMCQASYSYEQQRWILVWWSMQVYFWPQ